MRTAFVVSTSIMIVAGVFLVTHGVWFLITGSKWLPPVAHTITSVIAMIWSYNAVVMMVDDSPEKEEDNEDTQGS